jgi:3-oxoacyl-[acyl-carrier-protein] synthase-3
MNVYLTATSSFLPNAPVANDEIEAVLGQCNGTPSRTRRIILRNNGIRSRHYALDRATGLPTHTNAAMTAEAVRGLAPGLAPADIELLSCGTSTPDQLLPGHAVMVHGELGGGPLEAVTTHGICMSGMAAFKYAYLSVASGQTRNAVATGSELASSFIRAGLFAPRNGKGEAELESHPFLAFDADFLRWMLSDGAGAAGLSDRPAEEGLSLKVEWVESFSFAHLFPACMYAGAVKETDGRLTGWRSLASLEDAVEEGVFAIRQDVRLLNEEIVRTAVDRTLPLLRQRRGIEASAVDWFLPHYSSEFFKKPLADALAAAGFEIPGERWFSNLREKGNTGSASIFIILDELFRSGRIRKGDRLLLFVPESGRFSMCYALLTAV